MSIISEPVPYIVQQLDGIEAVPPSYDYEGLSLPSGLTIDAYTGAHCDLGDLELLRSTLKGCDVIVNECLGWDAPTVRVMQKVTKGDYKAREKAVTTIQLDDTDEIEKQVLLLNLSALYNAGKPLVVIDPPDGHTITKRVERALLDRQNSTYPPDFDTAIEGHRQAMTNLATSNHERENYMLQSFCGQINSMAESNPRIAKKLSNEGLSIVMFNFGLAHAGLFLGVQEVAKNTGVPLDMSVTVNVYPSLIIDHSAQACGRYSRGIEIDDELVARDIVADMTGMAKAKQKHFPITVANSDAVQEVGGIPTEELEARYHELRIQRTDRG